MFKKILLVLLVILIIIQFIHPSRNILKGEQPNNIANAFTVPAEVKTILDKACMDCHSNNTLKFSQLIGGSHITSTKENRS